MTVRFGNLSGKPPLGLKAGKSKPRPDYLAAVRGLPCVICAGFEGPQRTPTEAHHCIHGRHSQRKTPDIMAIPLCREHHTGARGIHTRSAWWREQFGPDTSFIAITQDALAHLLEAPHDQDQ